jgi:catechol 1,2-dioxygenase
MKGESMSDQKDQSNTSQPGPKGGFQPTKSLLSSEAWIEHIKETVKDNPLPFEAHLGPFYREYAPYRAKLGPPFEEGTVLVIKGHVWSAENEAGIPATMDIWHTNTEGVYDRETYINRARVRCDEQGYYEFETIYPGGYQRANIWRAPHIHFRVMYPGHLDCATQIYFEGDQYLDVDPLVKESIVVDLIDMERNGISYKEGEFDIVLAAKAKAYGES